MSTDEKYVHEMFEVLFHSNYDSRLEKKCCFFSRKSRMEWIWNSSPLEMKQTMANDKQILISVPL